MHQQAWEIAGQLRQSMPPRPRGTPQARPVHPPPRVTVTLPSPQPDRSAAGVAAGGVEAGVTTPPAQRPRAAGTFDSFPRALGPPAAVGCRLQAFLPAWAAFTDDAYVLALIRGSFVVELSEPLLGAVVRLPTPRMPLRIRAGMAAEITALLSKGVIEPRPITRDFACRRFFSAPSARGTFA